MTLSCETCWSPATLIQTRSVILVDRLFPVHEHQETDDFLMYHVWQFECSDLLPAAPSFPPPLLCLCMAWPCSVTFCCTFCSCHSIASSQCKATDMRSLTFLLAGATPCCSQCLSWTLASSFRSLLSTSLSLPKFTIHFGQTDRPPWSSCSTCPGTHFYPLTTRCKSRQWDSSALSNHDTSWSLFITTSALSMWIRFVARRSGTDHREVPQPFFPESC